MAGEQDFWACKGCRSINTARSSRCYSCHTPREAGGVHPSQLPTTGSAGPIQIVGTYRSSELWLVLVTLAAVVFVATTALSLSILLQIGELYEKGQRAAGTALFSERVPFYFGAVGATIVALVLYGLWMRQVVANLPHVGLGFARVSPDMAFVEGLVPGFNVYTIPARMADILQKLEGKGRGLLLVVIAWGLVIGPPVIVFVASRVARWVDDFGGWLHTFALLLIGSFAIQTVGLVCGLMAAWRIERLMRERAANGPVSTPPPAGTPPPAATPLPAGTPPPTDRPGGIEGIGRRL